MIRLANRGLITMHAGLSAAEWIALAALTAAFLYGEGERGIRRRWVPFVIRNTRRLRSVGRRASRLLAPLAAMGLVAAPCATLVRAWAGVFAIAAAVFIVRALPEPWRGIIDFAVAAALAWGLLGIAHQAPRAFR